MTKDSNGGRDRHERARALFRQADELERKARDARYEADALGRAAKRMSAMAAAVADGRDGDLKAIVLGDMA